MIRKKLGDFYLVEHIGTGGMADVYLALNPRTREKRAVKVMTKRATASAAGYARFMREVEIIQSVNHPNIVRIYDSGATDEFYYYTMEYLQGGSLAGKLGQRKTPLNEAIEIVTRVCSGLAFAHEKGIIHRDLKPANILMEPSGNPKLADFGIAKTLESGCETLTKSNEIMGTIAYLAPEQRVNTKRVDRRADVFAMGAILYEMLMGFPPLGNFPWPMEIQSDFPSSLQSILGKCLAINPADRFADAGTLYIELEKCATMAGDLNSQLPVRDKGISETVEEDDFQQKSDRIENWFHVLRTGTTRERLTVVREMVEQMNPREASSILKMYPNEGDRVRWGLIRVLGELQITGATPLLLNELRNPFQKECAVEALGKIGADEAFKALCEYIKENPEGAMICLIPLARTGKKRAIKLLQRYLHSEMSVLRQAAVRALAEIPCEESLKILNEQLQSESDDKVRSVLANLTHHLDGQLAQSAARSTAETEIITRG